MSNQDKAARLLPLLAVDALMHGTPRQIPIWKRKTLRRTVANYCSYSSILFGAPLCLNDFPVKNVETARIPMAVPLAM